jgi:SAM-dependent methyltransferase
MSWDFACPVCRAALVSVRGDELRCPRCGVVYPQKDGIWRLLAAGRREALRGFVEQYETVRSAEARVVRDPRHLRALPFRDPSGVRRDEWWVRSRSFLALLDRVVRPLERARRAPLRVVDGGSGLGWLAYRLAVRGHEVAAIDELTNDFDGLGVHRQYDRAFLPVQAEFDRLPFCDASVDLVVFNASFHYAADYPTTLREALRVVAADGRVVIMDSPIYRDARSGETMVRQRDDAFERRYGLRSAHTEGFLTYERLATLEGQLDPPGVRWTLHEPWYGVRWWLKPWVARLRGAREPARFKLVVGRRIGGR